MNEKSPSWTIAIPTYDGARYVAETIRSVLSQTDQEFETIVCDDGSHDETIEIVRSSSDGQARIIGNDSGRPFGLAGNWNRCVAEATGDWITILHQDDLLAPEFLARHRRLASENPEIGMIIGPVTMIDADGLPIESGNSPEFNWPETVKVLPSKALSLILATGNPIRCPGVSFRRNLHTHLGGFDAQWKYVLDWDFWHRVGQAAPVGIIDATLAKQRWHLASETQKLARGTIDLEENARLMRSIIADDAFDASRRSAAEIAIRRRMARAWTNRAFQAASRGDRRMEIHALKHAWAESPSVMFETLIRDPRAIARLILGKCRERPTS